MNGGWLGRVCTTLHLHAPYITHSTSTSFVSVFCFSHLDVRSFRSPVVFGVDAVLTDLQRAERKRLMRVRRSVCRHVVNVDEASACQVWSSRAKMCRSESGELRARKSAAHSRVRCENGQEATDCPLGDFAVERTSSASRVL